MTVDIAIGDEFARGVTLLGNPFVCLYLIRGKKTCLIDSGYTFMGPALIAQLRAVLGRQTPLDYLLLTHSHYDHISGVPVLRQYYPKLAIAAHPRLADIVRRPNAIELIRQLNQTMLPEVLESDMVLFEQFSVDHLLDDGETIDLGDGITIAVLATPGHTQDSLTYYLPHAEMIVPAEAAGVGVGQQHHPEFLQDYDTYLASITRLLTLPPLQYIGSPHSGVIAGEGAATFLSNAKTCTIEFRQEILTALVKYQGDLTQVAQDLFAKHYGPDVAQPEDAYKINLAAMIKAIARTV